MNKVISIHLHGVAFQLEEPGYDALRAYLDNAARQLEGNPDKAEILADIEQAIADKFSSRMAAGRNVVLTAEVTVVIGEIGPVDSGNETAADAKAKDETSTSPQSSKTEDTRTGSGKRLYRIQEGAMLAGVCNGLAAYIGIDVTLLRLAVAILIFFSFGTVAIAYIVAIIIIPKAETPEQKAATTGPSPTAQEFIRKAKEGYYEGFKTMHDREAHRAWKRKFKNEMRDWNRKLKQEFRWGYPCPPTPPPSPGTYAASDSYPVSMPLLSTLKAFLIFMLWFVIFSLIATKAVFGIHLPWGLPVWVGIVLAMLAYHVAEAPVKALQRSYYYRQQGRAFYWNPLAAFCQGLLTLCFLAIFIFLADQFIPSFHQALIGLPEFLRNFASNIQQWWAPK